MITLQYIPHHEIRNLDTESKIKKILKHVKENKIILIDCKLDPLEEGLLIERTMEEVDRKFKGIEIASIIPDKKNMQFLDIFKRDLAKILLGKDDSVTIIGPASIIKEIKKLHPIGPLYFVDLRQETHAFLNGFPVSWYGRRNGVNIGMSVDEITRKDDEMIIKLRNSTEADLFIIGEKEQKGKVVRGVRKIIPIKNIKSEKDNFKCFSCRKYSEFFCTDQ